MRVIHVAPTAFGRDGLFGGGERYPYEVARPGTACLLRAGDVRTGHRAELGSLRAASDQHAHTDLDGIISLALLGVPQVIGAWATPRTAVPAEIHDDEVRLAPLAGSEEVALTIVNVGQQPCELVVFITDDVNGPVDPVALPVRDGRVDFESTDFSEIEAAEGVEQGGPPMEPGERRSLTLGFQGTPVVTRVVVCNGSATMSEAVTPSTDRMTRDCSPS